MKLRRPLAPLELDGAEIVKIGAARAIYLGPDQAEIEIALKLRGGMELRMKLPPRLAHKLIGDLTAAYEAINPPLRRGTSRADFYGMDSNA